MIITTNLVALQEQINEINRKLTILENSINTLKTVNYTMRQPTWLYKGLDTTAIAQIN